MLSLPDRPSMLAALSLPLAPELHTLLADRIGKLTDDLIDISHLVVIDETTTEQQLIQEIGLSPLIHPSGGRFDTDDWAPWWDYLSRDSQSGFWELLICIGNSGFAYHLFVSPACSIPDLIRLCTEYAA